MHCDLKLTITGPDTLAVLRILKARISQHPTTIDLVTPRDPDVSKFLINAGYTLYMDGLWRKDVV